MIRSDSPIGIAGQDSSVETQTLRCPAGTKAEIASTIHVFFGPDTDVDISTVMFPDGSFVGIGEDDGLPEGTQFAVQLRVLCQ